MWITCVFSLSTYYSGFPDGTIVKNLPAMQETQETQVWSLDWEDPWRRKWQPIPVFCPGKFHGNRILVGTCPRVCKIVGHLERLSTHIKICITLVSRVQLFVTLWTVAHQAPLFMGIPGKDSKWSGLPCPPLEVLCNPALPHCRLILYCLNHQEIPRILEWVVACPFSRRSSRSRNQTGVSCIAGGFFTSWATREAHFYLIFAYKFEIS